ncbi:MAG: 50S ribosomal protein L13 [Deltaproteobacteria bacterium]|nr:50S ribosomal protein L13 [Deltaproteobacteria bacterium]
MKRETTTLPHKTALAARRWYLVDARGKTVGRLASAIAGVLRGKNNPAFSPHIDSGNFVVVINARQVRFSGNKLQDKIYYRHTEYPGGIRTTSAEQLLASRPEEVLRKAVTGMLPKTPLGRHLAGKVKIYPDANHPHAAQQPVAYSLGE